MKLLAFLARLAGAVLSLIVDMRRVKCPSHYPEPFTYPRICLTCFEPMP